MLTFFKIFFFFKNSFSLDPDQDRHSADSVGPDLCQNHLHRQMTKDTASKERDNTAMYSKNSLILKLDLRSLICLQH